MLFNLEKCSVMHMGKRNQEFEELYEMGGKVLKVSEEERARLRSDYAQECKAV